MYHIKPHVEPTVGDIVHTDNMYKLSISNGAEAFKSDSNQLDGFIEKKSSARSKLGLSLEDKKVHPNHEQQKKIVAEQEFKAAPRTEPFNEMNLDKYIIRKRAPASKLGKGLQSKREKTDNLPSDPRLVNRLKELEQTADAFLVPMGLGKSVEHIPASPKDIDVLEPLAQPSVQVGKPTVASVLADNSPSDPRLINRLKELEQTVDAFLVPMGLSKSVEYISASSYKHIDVLEPLAQPSGQVEKATVAPVSATVASPASSLPLNFADIAIHCDPKHPPFAILLYSKLLLSEGRNVSIQFYKHSSLTFVPDCLSKLEDFFTGYPRSSNSELILSIIWRPFPFGCMAISNPFTDLPLYGDSMILMDLSRLSSGFLETFENLSKINRTLFANDMTIMADCIAEFGKTDAAPFSIEEILLFISCVKGELSPWVRKTSKRWFDRCMSNNCFTMTKNFVDQFRSINDGSC